MEFNHWEVTSETIRLKAQPAKIFEFLKDRHTNYLKNQLYDPILSITRESWASDPLVYEFNSAFLYALIIWECPLDINAFRTSLEAQQELLRKRNCTTSEISDPFLSIH